MFAWLQRMTARRAAALEQARGAAERAALLEQDQRRVEQLRAQQGEQAQLQVLLLEQAAQAASPRQVRALRRQAPLLLAAPRLVLLLLAGRQAELRQTRMHGSQRNTGSPRTGRSTSKRRRAR